MMMNDVARRRVIRGLAMAFGMVVGGTIQNVARMTLPPGAVKEFFTTGFTWSMDTIQTAWLLIGSVSLGPVAVDVSILALLGLFATDRLAMKIFS